MQARTLRAAPCHNPAQPVANGVQHEQRVRHRITPPQTPRLGREPVEPLEPELAQPTRCAAQVAGVEIERRTDAKHDRPQLSAMQTHPALLFRTTESDE